ncbi:neurturin-like [Salmo salar]|uniref:Neurturin-like n=1 Tax=Salmo salar TaxID=8030 RepID=A0A1S3M247_SALSA|nr:neurturin-like [Salmo salar]|eukprot:XP_013996939.1 PREDICTED: neurturin-like [Salmo salar]
MKLWKGASFVFMLCAALLFLHLTRNIMVTTGPARLQPRITSSSSSSSSSSLLSSKPLSLSVTKPIPPPPPLSSVASSLPLSSSSSSSSSSSRMKAGLHRTARAVDTISSLLSQFSHLLQSFTEGELKKVIGTLIDRSSKRRGRNSGEESQESSSQRTKGAKSGRRKRLKPCSLREVEVTVGELGLGYDSDETLLFRYCSGRCAARRLRNYDIVLEHTRRAGLIRKGRRDKVHYSPCCRPIAYEKDISFLDNNSRYHTVQEVLARECGCA